MVSFGANQVFHVAEALADIGGLTFLDKADASQFLLLDLNESTLKNFKRLQLRTNPSDEARVHLDLLKEDDILAIVLV